jgi:uncharacterized membrane protein YphA (DoxX/SURF4 family)
MTSLYRYYLQFDAALTRWMAKHGIVLLRISIGIIFFWFGFLKFFPGLSPAADLATRTIEIITFGLIPPNVALILLAIWECGIGLGMITGKYMRVTLLLLFGQMAGTLTPLIFFPAETFLYFPIAPTMEGQYIIKNIALVSAGIVIGATVRGGRLESEPVPVPVMRAAAPSVQG